MGIKLTTTNISLAYLRSTQASDVAFMLKARDRLAAVTVHSDGRLIDDLIWSLESALEAAKAFKAEVQGR